MLAQHLTKLKARRFVERLKRLLDSRATSGVPDGCRLNIVQKPGKDHRRWRLVWDVAVKDSSAAVVDDLSKQSAPKVRSELNVILDTIYELTSSALVVDRLNSELADNKVLSDPRLKARDSGSTEVD